MHKYITVKVHNRYSRCEVLVLCIMCKYRVSTLASLFLNAQNGTDIRKKRRKNLLAQNKTSELTHAGCWDYVQNVLLKIICKDLILL